VKVQDTKDHHLLRHDLEEHTVRKTSHECPSDTHGYLRKLKWGLSKPK